MYSAVVVMSLALESVSPGPSTPPVSGTQLNILIQNTGQSLSHPPPKESIIARAPTVSS